MFQPVTHAAPEAQNGMSPGKAFGGCVATIGIGREGVFYWGYTWGEESALSIERCRSIGCGVQGVAAVNVCCTSLSARVASFLYFFSQERQPPLNLVGKQPDL